MCNLDKEIY